MNELRCTALCATPCPCAFLTGMCARSLCFGVWWAVTIEGAVTIKRSRTNISRVGHAFLDAYVDAYMGMEGTVNRNSLVSRRWCEARSCKPK